MKKHYYYCSALMKQASTFILCVCVTFRESMPGMASYRCRPKKNSSPFNAVPLELLLLICAIKTGQTFFLFLCSMILFFLTVPNILIALVAISCIHFLVASILTISRDLPVLRVYVPHTVRKSPGPRSGQKAFFSIT